MMTYCPRPMDKLYTKALLKMLSEYWNAEVDEYIASGVDKRSTLMIEQAAKLDPDFGPLWKRCEAPGCSVAERPGLKMKSCSACKRVSFELRLALCYRLLILSGNRSTIAARRARSPTGKHTSLRASDGTILLKRYDPRRSIGIF